MTQITVSVESKTVRQSLHNIGEAIDDITNAEIEAVMNEARDELAEESKPIRYPVQWDSEKQRRAYFATDGFGHGIPYKRTGGYGAAYEVRKTGYRTHRAYTLYNRLARARYIGGNAEGYGQSRIHRGRWPRFKDVVRKHAEKLVANIQAKINAAIRVAGMGL